VVGIANLVMSKIGYPTKTKCGFRHSTKLVLDTDNCYKFSWKGLEA